MFAVAGARAGDSGIAKMSGKFLRGFKPPSTLLDVIRDGENYFVPYIFLPGDGEFAPLICKPLGFHTDRAVAEAERARFASVYNRE